MNKLFVYSKNIYYNTILLYAIKKKKKESLFNPANSHKPTDIQLIIIQNRENQRIKLESTNQPTSEAGTNESFAW